MIPKFSGQHRVVIEAVSPQIDGGRYAVKRVIGEALVVEADIFADGHDLLAARLSYREINDTTWREVPMVLFSNDRWRGEVAFGDTGVHEYIVEAWIDHYLTWRRDLSKKSQAGQDVSVDLLTGLQLTHEAIGRASANDRLRLLAWITTWEKASEPQADRISRALDPEMLPILERYPDRRLATRSAELRVVVDPLRARTGAWYELFPRSIGSDGKRHGTFRDVIEYLPRVAKMGFDILYFPPIHPIGEAFRKGRNNNPKAESGEPGSPWAIGSKDGGHKSVHPALGTLDDFRALVVAAKSHGIEIALDIAFQCSPDHPYVREHPEWFKKRADGSIQYAENPPKKYQDIYPFDFETTAWESLWQELKSVFEFWIQENVFIFRVDNPHTKAFPFWEWVIGEIKARHPEAIFLAEAFTRPKPMYGLAKLGFTQSYNYFPWRNTSVELRDFMTELTRTPVREFYRPNLWPNTPDILPQYLQFGGRPAFIARLVLAATLGATYGIYGPAYELCVNDPRATGEEEYLESEKYELKAWSVHGTQNLEPLMTRINAIRRDNPALHRNEELRFHEIDNEQIILYSKRTEDRANLILVAVNLDPHHRQSGTTALDLEELGIKESDTFQVHNLLTGMRYLWRGGKNFIDLDTETVAAVYRLKRTVRSEQDFDYFG